MKDGEYHRPVLLDESIGYLDIRKDGIYIDATYGGGSHSAAILKQLSGNGKLFAFDQDPDAQVNMPIDAGEKFTFIAANFRHLREYMNFYQIDGVHGILADLGVSSHQLDVGERGFSYRWDALLDMRMDKSSPISAKDVLEKTPVDALQNMLSMYGELRNARTCAQAIHLARSQRPILTTQDLIRVIQPCIIGNTHSYQAQVFQAIRMEVNDEVRSLEEFLNAATDLLLPTGRLVVISYHSIEDRLVKNVMKGGTPSGEVISDFYGNIQRPYEILTKSPIVPRAEEIQKNSRARSAKLRAGTRLNNKINRNEKST